MTSSQPSEHVSKDLPADSITLEEVCRIVRAYAFYITGQDRKRKEIEDFVVKERVKQVLEDIDETAQRFIEAGIPNEQVREWKNTSIDNMKDGFSQAIEYTPGGGKRVPLEVRYDQIPPIALQQLAEVNEEGDKKYGGMQYMKGMPYSTFVNHMFNHLMMYCMGDRSALHMAKVAWGAFAIINMDDNGQALEHNDLTRNGPGVTQKTITTDWFKVDDEPQQKVLALDCDLALDIFAIEPYLPGCCEDCHNNNAGHEYTTYSHASRMRSFKLCCAMYDKITGVPRVSS